MIHVVTSLNRFKQLLLDFKYCGTSFKAHLLLVDYIPEGS